jgi:SNF2 family DNA or RNA helicase
VKLMQHQQRGVQLARFNARYYFAHEPGCGKTIMTLAIIADAKAHGFVGKTLVLCPLSILHCAWAQDAAHFSDLKTVVVYSTNKNERLRQLQTPGADVLVTNYETFKKLTDEFWAAGVRRLVVDEASKAKNHDTQITRAIQRFSARCTSVYMLSGTPCANGAHEWIPQLMALKPDLFGASYWQTMYRYFYPIKRTIGDKERIVAWRQIGDDQAPAALSAWQLIGNTPSEKVHPIKAEFLAKLRSCSWSLAKSECLDLPEQTDIVREVTLSDAEREAYDGMLESLRLELNGETIAAAMQARAMKLRQITGGAILHDERISVLGTSKMSELLAVLDEIGDRACVIWAEFTNEINRIAAAIGPNCQIINGQTPPASRTDAVHQFQAGKLRRLVCHPAAAGHGITLTAASHAIYFSHGYSFETYQQSRDRIHRAGQHSPCTYWHLTVQGTIDERILNCLKGKKDAHQAIFEELGIEQMQTV